MSELSDSLKNTFTINIAGNEYTISKMTLGIWCELEQAAENWQRKNEIVLATPEDRAMLPLQYLQTTRGRLTLLALCLNKAGNNVTVETLGDSISMSEMQSVIEIITKLIDHSQPVKLPGEDDGTGN